MINYNLNHRGDKHIHLLVFSIVTEELNNLCLIIYHKIYFHVGIMIASLLEFQSSKSIATKNGLYIYNIGLGY